MRKIIFFILLGIYPAWVFSQGFDTCSSAFEDITQSGTALHLSDDGTADLELPWDFTLYDITSRHLVVSNNGAIFFDFQWGGKNWKYTDVDQYSGPYFPMAFIPYWNDLGAETGDVYWEIKGTAPNRYLVVEWYQRTHKEADGDVTFEIILHEGTNQVEYRYADLVVDTDLFNHATGTYIGIKAHNNYFQYKDVGVELDTMINCLSWTMPDRYAPAFYTRIIPDCAQSQYSVDVIVTDMGGYTNAWIRYDYMGQDSTVMITGPDTLHFGPNPEGREFEVMATVNDTVLYSNTYTDIYFCPPPNDEYTGAIDIPVNQNMTCDNYYFDSNVGATPSGINAGLPGIPDDDVWYRFTAPGDTVLIRLQSYYSWAIPDLGYMEDPVQPLNLAVYRADSIQPVLMGAGQNNLLYLNHLEAGQTYYLQVYSPTAMHYADDKDFFICIMKMAPTLNDDCAHVQEIALDTTSSHVTTTLHVSTYDTSHDFDMACLDDSTAKDVIYKIRVPDHKMVGFYPDMEAGEISPYLGKKIYVAYGSGCPGDSLIACTKLIDSTGEVQKVTWFNSTGQSVDVYVVFSDTVSQGSIFDIHASIFCPPPPIPEYAEIHGDTAILHWQFDNDLEYPIRVEYVKDNDTTWYVHHLPPRTTSDTLTGLTEGHYMVNIGADCPGAWPAQWPEGICIPYSHGITVDFEGEMPGCWKNASDDMPWSFYPGMGPWNIYSVITDSTFNQFLGIELNNNAYFYVYRWLVMPELNLSNGQYHMTLDMGIMNHDRTDFITMPASDTLKIRISTDSGRTWTDLLTWDQAHSPTDITQVDLDLSNYNQEHVWIAFAAKYGYTNAAGRTLPQTNEPVVFIDNIQVQQNLSHHLTQIRHLQLYPNPAKHHIRWVTDEKVKEVSLLNTSGQILYTLHHPSYSYLDIRHLPAGVYILKIYTAQGVYAGRFIKN